MQPIVSSSTGKTLAFEALLRTSNSALSTPEHILHVAEKYDRIGALADILTIFERGR